jgi:hypothetical protein
MHPVFQSYTRDEFIAVVLTMLSRKDKCPPDLAEYIAIEVFDNSLGDVRQARDTWRMMNEPTFADAKRILSMKMKYRPVERRPARRKSLSMF